MDKLSIAVIAGGWSNEREISLLGGKAVFQELLKSASHAEMYDPPKDLKKLIEHAEIIDIAFVLLHGKFGEDGSIQGFLDVLGVPYVGSGVTASAMAANKKISKVIYRSNGLPVAREAVISSGQPFSEQKVLDQLGGWTIVKPLSEGSSVGMSVCKGEKELSAGIEKALLYGEEALIEEYIEGREVSCCVMGGDLLETLPIIEIVPGKKSAFFDFEAKYTAGAAQEICPAHLPENIAEKVQQFAIQAHKCLGCKDWSRTDMIIRGDDVFLLETNTIPGMTQNSLFPLAAGAAGLSFPI